MSGSRRTSLGTSPSGSPEPSRSARLLGADGTPSDNWWCTGEVVGIHIDTDLLVDGVYRTELAHPVVRGGGPSAYYELGKRFDLTRPD